MGYICPCFLLGGIYISPSAHVINLFSLNAKDYHYTICKVTPAGHGLKVKSSDKP